MRDPRDIARTERFIAQHQEQLAALRREADLRANESPKQTEQRHEAERKAEEAAKRHRRENPPPPSPEELERRRQAELARLERMKKADQLERIGHDVRVLIQQKAPNAWAKAQHDHPGNHDEAQRAARRVIRHEVNTAVGSRVWPGQVDEIFQRITRETFTMPKPQPTLAPEPKPIDKSQPRPRPKGPDYGM